MAQNRVRVGGPYFEDLARGQVYADAPGLTLTSGLGALHQALSGDRLRLPLDHELSAAVTDRAEKCQRSMVEVCSLVGTTVHHRRAEPRECFREET